MLGRDSHWEEGENCENSFLSQLRWVSGVREALDLDGAPWGLRSSPAQPLSQGSLSSLYPEARGASPENTVWVRTSVRYHG